jgi:hypothetical protein
VDVLVFIGAAPCEWPLARSAANAVGFAPSPSAGVDTAEDVAKRLHFTEYSPDGNVIPVEPTAFRLTLAKTF